jgi:hypothetical protein
VLPPAGRHASVHGIAQQSAREAETDANAVSAPIG